MWLPPLGAEFGLFKLGGADVSGFKGYATVPFMGQVGIFVPGNGSPKFLDISKYKLYNPFAARALSSSVEPGLEGRIIDGVYYSPEPTVGDDQYGFNVPGGNETVSSRGLDNIAEEDPDAEVERIVFAIGYEEGEPELTAISPSGVEFGFSDPGVELMYTEWGAVMVVMNPEPGEWSLRVGNMPGPDSYIIEVMGKQAVPELSINTPEYRGRIVENSIEIEGQLNTTNGEPGTVEIYITQDPYNYAGEKAGEIITSENGTFSYNLDTSYLQEGEYYIYSSYSYKDSPAVRMYAPGSIKKDNDLPLAAVEELVVAASPDGELKVSFTNTNGDRSKGYKLYYKADSEPTPVITELGNITNIELFGYTPETSGEVWVRPYSSRGEDGPVSEVVSISFSRTGFTHTCE